MKVCTVIGARPQFIKAATVSRVIQFAQNIDEIIIHTGQHYDANMSDCFFDELCIPNPHYHLNIGSGLHGKQTGQMLIEIEQVLLKEKPDWVLVYGDTNSTFAGALAAAKLHIPVAHVEAGLRSFNQKMPEELNRIVTDHLSTLLFTPNSNSFHQLIKEGIAGTKIVNVGDVMYDATLFYNEYNTHRKTSLDTLQLHDRSYCLATIHRAENTDCESRLKNICEALIHFSQSTLIVLPLHPRTRKALQAFNLFDALNKRIKLIDPVGYLDMLALEQNANCIITDSGGVQKEAYFNKVPCITLRDETEWTELVDSGWNQICSPNTPFSLHDRMLNEATRHTLKYEKFYGNGNSAGAIVDRLLSNSIGKI